MTLDYSERKQDCTACSLRENSLTVTRGKGSREAAVMIYGGSPDNASYATENAWDERGYQGRRMTWLLRQLGLSWGNVWSSYVTACAIGNKGVQTIHEADAVNICRYWVKMEIARITAGYRQRGENTWQMPVLIAVGSLAAQSLLELPQGTPAADYMGTWQKCSLVFPDQPCFVLYDFETLQEGVRTKIIEEEWRVALENLEKGLRMEEILPWEYERPPRPWPVCEGFKKQHFPCRCDQLIEDIWKRIVNGEFKFLNASNRVSAGNWED